MLGLKQNVPPTTDEKTSALLRRVMDELPPDKVRIGHIVRQLRRRSFGGILILLAMLALLPAISFLAGLAMILPGLQMLSGFRAPLLPRVVRQREIGTDRVRALGMRAIPWIEKLERVVRPRWLFLTLPPMPSVVGFLVIGLALVVMLPLPFSNLPPAIALTCLALGLLERDGVIILVGAVVAAIALFIGVVIAYVAIESILLFAAERF